jgi:branched-chain amino acid aminotransferase
MTTVWVGGRVVPDGTGQVAALDHGVTVGDGAFETCKVTDGVPFALTRHLARLRRSLAVLAIPAPDDAQVRAAVAETVAAASGRSGGRLPLGRLRITVTAGPGPLGSDRSDAPPTLVVAVAPAAAWPPHIEVATVPWTRNERSAVAGAKTTSYAENVVALRSAKQRGAHEALLANTAGLLCEGTGSNVVVLDGERLVTPPLSSGCLAGISRELLLEWAREEGLPLVEADVPFERLADAEDVLLTSSTRDVQPVNVVDGRPLPGSALGKAAVDLFARRAAQGTDP